MGDGVGSQLGGGQLSVVSSRRAGWGGQGADPCADLARVPGLSGEGPDYGRRAMREIAVLVFDGGLVSSLREYWASGQIGQAKKLAPAD